MNRKTGNKRQLELEAKANGLIKKYGTGIAVSIIKDSTVEVFSNRQHFPRGVYVYCNSPLGGLMVGSMI